MHDPAAHHPATPAQLESWDAQRQRSIAQQIRDAERRKGEDRAAIASGASEAAAQKKRAEREARRQQRQLAEAAAAAEDDVGSAVVIEGPAVTDAPSSPSPSSQPPANATVYTVAVPTTSDAFAWYAPGAHTYETLDAAREAGVWTYPATKEERARCEVFRDLWEKGYYLGGGGKFGGDWLVYPGMCVYFLSSSAGIDLLPPFTCTCRRSAALSFSLRCDRADLPVCPITSDGDRGAWSVGHGDKKGTSIMWMGRGEPRGYLHQRRVGRVRVVKHT